jgi:uncharacterized protein
MNHFHTNENEEQDNDFTEHSLPLPFETGREQKRVRQDGRDNITSEPHKPAVEEYITALEFVSDDEDLMQLAAEGATAIGFVHFDSTTAKSNMVEALVHYDDLARIDRGMYVHIQSRDGYHYSGRIVEGPFYIPDALKRDSTPVQFIILNQSRGKVLSLPEYHGIVQIEILGEERANTIFGAVRRPRPASPIIPYDATLMESMLNLKGNIQLGHLDVYENIPVNVNGNDKNVARNWMTVGTIGSGKSNTNQVFIEETLAINFAQVVVDPEGEYIFMDDPSTTPEIENVLRRYHREPRGVESITVYRPPLAESKRKDAIEFSVPFDSLSPDIIVELLEMSPAQQTRFTFLYEQAIQRLRKDKPEEGSLKKEDLDLSRGYPGIRLDLLIGMLDEELHYYQWKQANRSKKVKSGGNDTKKKSSSTAPEQNEDEPETEEELKIYCHTYRLEPLVQDHQDVVSFSALRKKLRQLQMTRIFDRPDAPSLDMKKLSEPGHLSVIDMSDSNDQHVVNIVIADLLARMYDYKMNLSEAENTERKVCITIEEAHGFVSREKQDRMEQTLDQLRRIARRGRKRWLVLHFVTQSPQHLPSELFELANNKIIHQTTGTENLRVLKVVVGTVNEAIWQDVPSLGRGRAIIVSEQYPHPLIVRIRPAASRRNYMI